MSDLVKYMVHDLDLGSDHGYDLYQVQGQGQGHGQGRIWVEQIDVEGL